MADHFDSLDFADEHDAPVRYIERTRSYYQALGFDTPYRWARYAQVPFQPLTKPLSECRIGLLTTAAPYLPGAGDQGPGAAYNAAAKFYRVYSASTDGEPDVRISHVGIDRAHTSAEDINTWFPLAQLKRQARKRRIRDVAPRFYGLPTNRSHRVTLEQDCPDALRALREDGVDAAVLVAN